MASEPASAGAAGSIAFRQAVRWVIDVAEGGSRLITDQGGLTKFGVSQNAHPELDIATLTREQAEAAYTADYWTPIQGDGLPPSLALCLFDGAVNLGAEQAIKLLQQCLDVEADGIMGPETRVAALRYTPGRELLAQYLAARLRFYSGLASAWPEKHGASLRGWHNRVMRLALEAGRWGAA